MKLDALHSVCVAGAGQMGRQIALNNAIYGYETRLFDTEKGALESARSWADHYWEGRIAKGRMTPEAVAAAKEKLIFCSDLEEAAGGADLVVEAIIEQFEAKKALFSKLCKLVSEDAIICSNSSSMVPSTFQDVVTNPARFGNLHYFNPALVMKLTEVVGSPLTSPETLETLAAFSKATGKRPVVLKKEIDGFIANRVLRAIDAEAIYLVEAGIAEPEDIDAALELGLGHPMGPFRMDDLVGLDVRYLIMKKHYEETGIKRPGYDVVEAKYQAGELGKKTGKGWYDYSKEA